MNRIYLAAALAWLSSCHRALPPASIDPAMASCIPAGTVAIAGLNLEQLRTSPLYPLLPPAALSLMEPFHDARSLLAAYSGKDLLVVAGGAFAAPPPGATLIAPGLALAGSPASMQAARLQHQANAAGEPELVAQAESVAPGRQIWIVVRGGVSLPLTGNAANVNRLLRDMEFAAIAVGVSSAIDFEVIARGRTPDAARHFEDTLRATLTMVAVGEARQPDLAALLRSVQVRRDDRAVHATLSTNTDAARRLLQAISP